jgi:putative membrane protein
MVRDATGNLLPFSTLGGFVLGARAVSLHGVPFALATASTFADVTVEFLAEVSFAVLGLLALMRLMPDSALLWPVGLGLLVAGGLGAGAVLTQRGLGGIFRFLSARIAAPWFQGISGHAERLQAEIDAIYRRPKRLFAGYALHLLCWFGTAGASWLAFRLIGAPLSYPSALAIEALLHAALTAGFMIPGSLGVQELAYTGLGAMFGCPPDIALGVSLLRRARS